MHLKKVAAITGIIILVSADLLIIPPDIAASVAMLLSEEGISREQLVFSATHSHSSLGGWGPGFVGKQFAGDENYKFQWQLCRLYCSG